MRSERVVHDPAAVLGDHVEEVVDGASVRTVPLDLEGEGRVHVYYSRLDALALLGAELLEELPHRRAIPVSNGMDSTRPIS